MQAVASKRSVGVHLQCLHHVAVRGVVVSRRGRQLAWCNCVVQRECNLCTSTFVTRITHLMVLEHYQQTKNLPVSYSENKLGFF